MKFFLVNGELCDDAPKGPAFKEVLDDHHRYWAPYIASGNVLIAGPKMAGLGLFVLKAEDEATLKEMVDKDPFVTRNVVKFTISEFKPFFKAPILDSWFSE